MAAQGVVRGIELGHGTIIKGLVKRIASEIEVVNVGQPEDIKSAEL